MSFIQDISIHVFLAISFLYYSQGFLHEPVSMFHPDLMLALYHDQDEHDLVHKYFRQPYRLGGFRAVLVPSYSVVSQRHTSLCS